MIQFVKDDKGEIKRCKLRRAMVGLQFARMVKSVVSNRVKFLYFSNNKPMKCSGYFVCLVTVNDNTKLNYSIKFRDINFGKSYSKYLYVPLKNIRFIRQSMINYCDYISKNDTLSNFFYNHFEKERTRPLLTKFSFL